MERDEIRTGGGRREDVKGWRYRCLDRGTKVWGEITRSGRQIWKGEMQRWKGGGAVRWSMATSGLRGKGKGEKRKVCSVGESAMWAFFEGLSHHP